MSQQYRIRAEDDPLERYFANGADFVVERKTGWFSWETVHHVKDPAEFREVIEKDMKRLRKEGEEQAMRDNFKPVHAAAYWLRDRFGAVELRIQIDTKG
ncbi:hypothetical protein [Agrobacterium sp. CFBP2214]|uniref:hypothetical protein n=1 Tax=Agrobacterium sp. CFBP2214 TaxID=3040274 RepID=UPI000DCF877C|nr:hypothetical protein [Agrobacterium sp. CFBP2214]